MASKKKKSKKKSAPKVGCRCPAGSLRIATVSKHKKRGFVCASIAERRKKSRKTGLTYGMHPFVKKICK